MKFLINSNFECVRKGSSITADETVGEVVLDKDSKFAKTALVEIAQANKIKLNIKQTPSEMLEIILEGLKMNEKIAEQNQQTETQKVQDIVKKMHEQGKNEESILIELVKEGFGFKKVAKLYQGAVIALGLAVNTKDLKTRGGEIMLKDEFKPITYDQVDAMHKKIQAEFPKAESAQISSVIRRWLRANKIEIPTAPKGQRGAVGIYAKVYEFLLKNPNSTEKDLIAFLKEEDKESYSDRFVAIFKFAKDFASLGPVAASSDSKPAKAKG